MPDCGHTKGLKVKDVTNLGQSLKSRSKAKKAATIFLEQIWRGQDCVHQIFWMQRDSGKSRNQPISSVEHAATLAVNLSNIGVDSYFAIADYFDGSSRTAANVKGAYCYWLDIDCGPEKAEAGKGYLTPADAITAIYAFCEKAGLPKPNLIVLSGGGIHAYWVVKTLIERHSWKIFADAFKALTKALNLLADPARTADIASVLRIPGTFNYKYSPPRPVLLIYATNEYYDSEQLHAAISAAVEKAFPPVSLTPESSQAFVASSNSSPQVFSQRYGPHNLPRLASALAYIDPDCDEPTWAMGCLAALAQSAIDFPELHDDLYRLARYWSSGELCGIPSKAWHTPGKNGRSGKEIFDLKWERFINTRYAGKPSRLGTVIALAKAAGWTDPLKGKGFDALDEFEIVDPEGADDGK